MNMQMIIIPFSAFKDDLFLLCDVQNYHSGVNGFKIILHNVSDNTLVLLSNAVLFIYFCLFFELDSTHFKCLFNAIIINDIIFFSCFLSFFLSRYLIYG